MLLLTYLTVKRKKYFADAGFCLLRVHAVSCNNKISTEAQMLCFVDQGIETDLKKIDLVHTLLDLNVTDTCRFVFMP